VEIVAIVMIVIHLSLSAALIVSAYKQMGKFAELGGAFGSGALHTHFGREKGLDAGGKLTLFLGAAFVVSCIATAFFLVR
jgi:preprotein translocase subunit SecG